MRVAFEDTTLIVGAQQDYNPKRAPTSDATHVLRKFGATWTRTKRFIALDAEQNANLGRQVAVSGFQEIVGAPTVRVNGQNTQGSVYVFSAASKNDVADFDSDGRVDLSIFRSSEANWFTRQRAIMHSKPLNGEFQRTNRRLPISEATGKPIMPFIVTAVELFDRHQKETLDTTISAPT